MGRKGYANEGAVTESEQAPFRPLTARSLGERWTPPEQTIEENIGPKARELMENYPQKLGQAIQNAPSAAYEFVKYPGQLLYGEKEYNPEEAVNWSGGLATNMLGASSPFALAKMPTAAEAASTTRLFAGLGADTADVAAYRAAKAAREAGVSPDKIWKEHGWGWTKDDKPFFEISDQRAAFTPRGRQAFENGQQFQGHLEDILHHPEFFAAYPEARRMGVSLHSDNSNLGQSTGKFWEDPKFGYMQKGKLEVRSPTHEKALDVLMHEVNHGIQGYENFPRGANRSAIKEGILADVQKRMDEVLAQRAQYEEAIAKAPDAATRIKMRDKIGELTENYKDISAYRNLQDFDLQASREYWKTHGEADSRNVQHRLDMSADERRQLHPRHTLDVPEEELILRYHRENGGRAGYLAGGMPEVIDLETEVSNDTSSLDGSDDSPANFFRQDKELQQSRPEMFQQKTYKPYTAWEDEPAATPARQPMAYAPSDTSSRGPAMDAISGATDSDRPNPPRPIPPGNIPNVPQAKNVDPRLFSILNTAGKNLPEGWSWNVTPSGGFRPGDPRFHGKGMAVDVQLVDDQGKPLPNYQNAAAFRAYEQFAQAARKAQLDLHPELSSQLRWGGYFSGPVGKYGAKDLMHFDLGGDRIPMGGGSWDTGLHERERRYLPGAKSVGMGNYAKGGSIADRAIMVMSRQAQSQRGRP
jgi:hypothetical protein